MFYEATHLITHVSNPPESQLSPHAPEFQPTTSGSPDLLDDKATFGEFSQESGNSDTPVESTEPAVVQVRL